MNFLLLLYSLILSVDLGKREEIPKKQIISQQNVEIEKI
jgi:hypothetical protein